jgi:RNA polymerase sigma-70 factor (ECF subfamily)
MTHSPEDAEDRRLVGAFLERRDERSFLALYDRHTEALFRFAARLSGGPGGDADELVQESWIRALESLSGFRWESRLRTWLCGIVLNRWRDRRARGEREERFRLVTGGRTPEAAPAPPASDRLGRLLETLPEGYRTILLLHDLEGYTHEEIAGRLGIAPGTSKSQLHRARRALRERLGGGTEVAGDG